jgi:predicted Zn-dependent protease
MWHRRRLFIPLSKCIAGAILTLMGSSCASGDVEAEIDVVFTQPQASEITRAAKRWNEFTTRTVHIVSDGEWLVVPATSPKGLGYAQGARRLIRISPVTPDDQIYAVALHEFGHALGLNHVPKGVMDPDRQTIEFSPEDIAECKRCGACPD